jgi:hypothetical protein
VQHRNQALAAFEAETLGPRIAGAGTFPGPRQRSAARAGAFCSGVKNRPRAHRLERCCTQLLLARHRRCACTRRRCCRSRSAPAHRVISRSVAVPCRSGTGAGVEHGPPDRHRSDVVINRQISLAASALPETERVELGRLMTAHAVGLNQVAALRTCLISCSLLTLPAETGWARR